MNIAIQKSPQSRINSLDFSNIKFGKVFADHQLMADYGPDGWGTPLIMPFGEIPLNPAISALHYGQAFFEGMKAAKSESGEILLFRPEENWKRANHSARRMCMPEIPHEIFIDGLKELLRLDSDWIPAQAGSALYIRPFMFATDAFIGVKPSETYKFMIFCCPVSAYYSEHIRIKIETHYTRAFEGGVGSTKCAGNYGAALYPARLGQEQGYHQLLWTDGLEHKYIEEIGTSNVFFVMKDKVITPDLTGTILAGITRDSVIALLKDAGTRVEERRVSIQEIVEAHNSGDLVEMFATGTAATIAKIKLFHHAGHDYEFSNPDNWETASWLQKTLDDIKRGALPDKFNWIVKV